MTTIYPGFQPDGVLRDESEATRKNATQSLGVSRTVNTISDLASLAAYDGQTVQCRDRSTLGDGSGPLVRFVSSDTTTANGGFVIDDGSNTGRWHVVTKRKTHVRDWGAVGDGVTDDTASIQAAMDAMTAIGGGVVELDAGEYDFTRLIIRSNVTLSGAGVGCTFLVCKDGDTLDAGVAFGSAIRRPDDNAAVSRPGFRDLYICTAISSVSAAQDANQDLIGLNLFGCPRAEVENVGFGGFGFGAIVFGRCEGGTEGFGFTSTPSKDGNYITVKNIYMSSCGKYGTEEGALWLAYKANSNKFFGVFAASCEVGIALTHANDNAFFGGTAESVARIAQFGANAIGNTICGYRGEAVSDDAFDFLAGSSSNFVLNPYLSSLSGESCSMASGGTGNWFVGAEKNYFRTYDFPPASNYSTLHNHGAMEVTSLIGSVAYPLYVKSGENNDSSSWPKQTFYSSVLGPTAGTVLAELSIYNSDTSTGRKGENAYIRAVAAGAIGDTDWVFAVGDSDAPSEVFRVMSGGGVSVNGGPEIHSGTGTPEGAVSAPVGSTFHRTDGSTGTSFYVKETGATTSSGWVAK